MDVIIAGIIMVAVAALYVKTFSVKILVYTLGDFQDPNPNSNLLEVAWVCSAVVLSVLVPVAVAALGIFFVSDGISG